MIAKKRAAIVGGTALLVAVGSYVGLARRGDSAPVERTPEVVAVAEQDMNIVAEAAGQVEPIRTVDVKSKASGEVLKVYVETGDRVEQGTLLAEIDPRDVQSALDQAAADLDAARVQASTTGANRERMEELRKSNSVTQQEYESAVQSAAAARASVVRAETSLRLAKERRNDVTIRAPISGTIIARGAEPGLVIASATANVSGGSALFTMADLSEMQVRAMVNETDVGQIQPGQGARVTVQAYPNRTFMGEVLKMEPKAVVEQNVTNFPVLIRLANPDELLKPGMNADVTVEIASRRGVLVIPNTAVTSMKDVATTAAAFGLDEEAVRTALRPAGAAPGAPGAAGGPGASGASSECVALFEKLRGGGGPGSLSEADRAQMQKCRAELGGGGGGGMRMRQGGTGGPGGGGWQGPGRGGRQAQAGAHRPGVVFVQGANGVEPRRVTLGLSDWEHTEVVEGLKAGEQVYPVTAVQLLQKQKEQEDRMRQRSGGMLGAPGGGGGGGGVRVRVGG